MTQLLVNVSMRFPAEILRSELSYVLAPVVKAAVAAGGLTTSLSVQPLPDAESPSLDPAIYTGEEASPTSPQLSVAPDDSGGDR